MDFNIDGYVHDITFPVNIILLIYSRLELEAKLQEVDRKKIDEEAARHVAQERVGERIAAANSARDSAEKELLVLK